MLDMRSWGVGHSAPLPGSMAESIVASIG
jgi:hypothetical protein